SRSVMKKRWLVWSAVAVAFGLDVGAWVLIQRPWHDWRVEALNDESPAVRAAAIRALPREGNEERLIDRLRDENSDVRLVAAARLGGPGPKGAERAWALIRLLGDEHLGVRRDAAWALSHIGPEAWPAIREALQDTSPIVRAG